MRIVCPVCGGRLEFYPEEFETTDEPGQPAVMICDECGYEEKIDDANAT